MEKREGEQLPAMEQSRPIKGRCPGPMLAWMVNTFFPRPWIVMRRTTKP